MEDKKYSTRLGYLYIIFQRVKTKKTFGKIEKYFTKHKKQYFYKYIKFLNYGN